MVPHTRTAVASLVILAVTAVLSGCAPTISLERAGDGISTSCAEVIARLPGNLAESTISAEDPGVIRRETDAQGTAAWGDPASVILRCGVPSPSPTTLRCVTVNGVDWVIDEGAAPKFRITTYGRTPAVEVIVDNSIVSGTTVITELSAAVGSLPITGACTNNEPAPKETQKPGA